MESEVPPVDVTAFAEMTNENLPSDVVRDTRAHERRILHEEKLARYKDKLRPLLAVGRPVFHMRNMNFRDWMDIEIDSGDYKLSEGKTFYEVSKAIYDLVLPGHPDFKSYRKDMKAYDMVWVNLETQNWGRFWPTDPQAKYECYLIPGEMLRAQSSGKLYYIDSVFKYQEPQEAVQFAKEVDLITQVDCDNPIFRMMISNYIDIFMELKDKERMLQIVLDNKEEELFTIENIEIRADCYQCAHKSGCGRYEKAMDEVTHPEPCLSFELPDPEDW